MAITNAQLAQQISNLVDYWRTRDVEFAEWLSGAPDGGPYGDGRFPLSDYLGVTQYLKSPAALQASVAGSAEQSSQSAEEAAEALANALLALTAAETARDLALSYQTGAQQARDLASMYADNAANSQANAQVYRNKARDWASKAVDSVVESGLYSALHYATKASETYDALQGDLNDATDAAVAQATADATASATAAQVAQLAAEAAQSTSEDARDLAQQYKTEAGASAAAAAASAEAAATFNPALYARIDTNNTFTGDSFDFGKSGSTRGFLRLRNGTDVRPGYMEFVGADNIRLGYIGWLSASGRLNLAGELVGWNFLGIAPTINDEAIFFGGTDVRCRGQGRFTGWYNTLATSRESLAVELGVAGTDALINSYDRLTLQYGPLILRGTKVAFRNQSGGEVFRVEDGVAKFLNGVWHSDINGDARLYFTTGGATHFRSSDGNFSWRRANDAVTLSLNNSGTLTAGGDVNAAGFRWNTDNNFYIYNTSARTYGSWRIGGSKGGYVGLCLDDGARLPTFMAGSTWSGVYNQGTAKWVYRENGTEMWLEFRPMQSADGTGALLRYTAGQTGGRVYVQQGGSPQGSQEGDITLIW